MPTIKTLSCLAALGLAIALASHAREPGGGIGKRLRAAQGVHMAEAGMRVLRDAAYGAHPDQRMDLYLPKQAVGAPVIMMVHGGGWSNGDKAGRGVAADKARRWVARGAIVVSINYRMLPETRVADQAQDVALAAKFLQRNAPNWGGDGRRVILMGHSAGAHLVALVAADTRRFQVADPLGTVILDSASLDVPKTMQGPHFKLHDQAFGSHSAYWREVSPIHTIQRRGGPLLVVCSSRRQDSCPQAEAFAKAAQAQGRQAQVLAQDLTHGQVNHDLGLENDYTRQVERFLGRIAPELR